MFHRVFRSRDWLRFVAIFGVQLVLVVGALYLAFLVRLDFRFDSAHSQVFWQLLPVAVVGKLSCFYFYGLFRGWWRYVCMADLLNLFKANVAGSLVLICYAAFVLRLQGVPRSILLLDGVFCFLLTGGARFAIRAWRERYYPMLRRSPEACKRVLVVGAGSAGQSLVRELSHRSDICMEVVGFVDDDLHKQKNTFQGVGVLGTTAQLQKLCRRHHIHEVIIAIPSVRGAEIKEMMHTCCRAGVSFKTLPSVTELVDGTVSLAALRNLDLEDLLGRDAVRLDDDSIRGYLGEGTVLITGAGGSIGSELCRQVARFGPKRLVLFENAETPLFNIEQELSQAFPAVRLVPILGDVRYRARVEGVFDEFMPDAVFHAAAYKHVPLVEGNPAEAVNNNVRGTRNVAEVARQVGVRHFVLVSTDKAVNPTNIMGASKRVAEKVVQGLAADTDAAGTRFVTVRFGNVLGSNGSVIPTFREQISRGGPVTVTHPEVTRYFMTIPEAAQLVLQAGSMGSGGEIFLLDMGQPVKILQLAEDLIRLHGLQPYDDMPIEFTGLRPGEKLYEELLLAQEGVVATLHEKIWGARAQDVNSTVVGQHLELLEDAARRMDLRQVAQLLHEMVPEYHAEAAA